jgi:glutamyl-tRNA reductase
MTLLAIGLNHETAPLALRERVAFAHETLALALRDLLAIDGVHEAVMLSTCNRTEIYAHTEDGQEHVVAQWLGEHHQLGSALDGYLYQHTGADAAKHLFRVATGLDSLILGEPQILGQVKEAWQIARNAGVMKTALDRLFQHTFSVAKRVRTDTRIGTHPVSVAFAGVRLAQQVFTDLREATVLLIGAGDTIELAARHLSDAKAKRLLVANRTLAHAQDLASRHGGYALALPDLDRHLAEADIVIAATASREPVLSRLSVEKALRARRQRPMFMLDLAVPRDIEASVRDLDDVYLYTVDDLDQVIAENRQSRREAADQAEAIIDLQVAHFMGWWQGAGRQTTITRVRSQSEQIRDETLHRARALLASGKDPAQALEFLAHNLTNKLLHAPSASLRQAALSGDTDLLRAAERLFDLATPENPDDAEPTSQA